MAVMDAPATQDNSAVLKLWALPRGDAEDIYRKAFEQNDPNALRWLARNDIYFLLSCILRRPDVRDDWLFARCREWEADPDEHLDVWAREHFKMLAVGEPVPTPSGWREHGDLRRGDLVFGSDGAPCTVVAVTEIFTDGDCHEIEFTDGTKIKAGDDHLWPVGRKSRHRVAGTFKTGVSCGKRHTRDTLLLTTKEIAAGGHSPDKRYSLDASACLDLPECDSPVEPYLLGVWLGDGGRGSARITCGPADATEMTTLLSDCGMEVNQTKHSNAIALRIGSGRRGNRSSSDFTNALRTIGVYSEKQIPKSYLRASRKQRLRLLQGLMDSDGTCNPRGTAMFCNVNRRLANGVFELAASLGLNPKWRDNHSMYNGEPYLSFQVSFQAYEAVPCFRLKRKLARSKKGSRKNNRRFIKAVAPIPSEPMSCIQVDREDGIYLVGRAMIPTHNSTIITFAGTIQLILNDPEVTVGIFSVNRPLAKAFLKQIMVELEDNKLLQSLFPDIFYETPQKQSRRWGEDSGLIVKRNSNPPESTVEAHGLVDGMPTGRHFMYRIYDDVVTEKSVTSPEMIKKVTECFDLSEYLGKRGGKRRIIGTRYHFADTYGVLIRREKDAENEGFERRHAATDDGEFDGKPVFLTQKEWDKRLQQPKSVVAAQMLLNPMKGAETVFDIRLLKFWVVRPKRLNIYIICDPSKGRQAKSDRTAITIQGVDINKNVYFLDGWCHRMTLSQRWTTLRDAYKRWSSQPGVESVRVGYEQFGMQTDIEYFELQMEVEKFSFPIDELKWPRTGPKSKTQRIERMEPEIRMGRFKIPCTVTIDEEGETVPYDCSETKAAQQAIANREEWRVAKSMYKKDEDGKLYNLLTKFFEEFIFFPVAPYDDILDSLSRLFDMKILAPVHYDEEPGRPTSTMPNVYVDGV